jgi:single-strand DNA-binding protein
VSGFGLNRVTILGNLGADAELRVTSGGQAILKMRVAVTESYKDRNDQQKERTEWVSCSLWGKRGESLAKFLSKGSRVYVEGRLQTSSYDKNGEKRYVTEVNVSNVILCGGRSEVAGQPQRRETSSAGSIEDATMAPAASVDESDIPF